MDENHHIDDFFNHPDIVNHPALPILARQGRDFISGRGKSLARQFLNRQDTGFSQFLVSVPKSKDKLVGILKKISLPKIIILLIFLSILLYRECLA